MMSFNMLLCAVVLVLAVSVEAFPSSGGYDDDDSPYLSGQTLRNLYNSPVYEAVRMFRPKGSNPAAIGPFSHSGVRVTLADNSQWLIHKGSGYGTSSNTVVTSAQHMSSRWTEDETRNFQGTKTVADFVAAGGPTYSWWWNNCHRASRNMMRQ